MNPEFASEYDYFAEYCKSHNIRLVQWQGSIVFLLLSQKRGAGKTFLISALRKFDKRQSRRVA